MQVGFRPAATARPQFGNSAFEPNPVVDELNETLKKAGIKYEAFGIGKNIYVTLAMQHEHLRPSIIQAFRTLPGFEYKREGDRDSMSYKEHRVAVYAKPDAALPG